MSPDLLHTPSGRIVPLPNRHRRSPRLDRPDFRPGNMAWWKAGLYEVESIELHGEQWIAVLVRPGELGKAEVRCWFAPVRELQSEPGR